MAVIKVKIVPCPACSYRFSPRSAEGKIVKAPRAVIQALLGNKQTCPACRREFKEGELLSSADRARLAEDDKKRRQPKRKVTCSKCGKKGHNKLHCPTLIPIAEPDEHEGDDGIGFDDEDGLSNDDLGLCPHGCSDDEGCDEPGCLGGPEGAGDDPEVYGDFDDDAFFD